MYIILIHDFIVYIAIDFIKTMLQPADRRPTAEESLILPWMTVRKINIFSFFLDFFLITFLFIRGKNYLLWI